MYSNQTVSGWRMHQITNAQMMAADRKVTIGLKSKRNHLLDPNFHLHARVSKVLQSSSTLSTFGSRSLEPILTLSHLCNALCSKCEPFPPQCLRKFEAPIRKTWLHGKIHR